MYVFINCFNIYTWWHCLNYVVDDGIASVVFTLFRIQGWTSTLSSGNRFLESLCNNCRKRKYKVQSFISTLFMIFWMVVHWQCDNISMDTLSLIFGSSYVSFNFIEWLYKLVPFRVLCANLIWKVAMPLHCRETNGELGMIETFFIPCTIIIHMSLP